MSISPAASEPSEPGNCPIEKAIYVAELRHTDEDVSPDELRFTFNQLIPGNSWNPDSIKGAIINSPEMGIRIKFGTWFQNNTAIEGISGEVEPKDFSARMNAYWRDVGSPPEKFEASSVMWVVSEDFDAWHLPYKGGKTPVLVILPEFRSFAHSSNNGLVSTGIAWGVFRFARCEE